MIYKAEITIDIDYNALPSYVDSAEEIQEFFRKYIVLKASRAYERSLFDGIPVESESFSDAMVTALRGARVEPVAW